MPRLRGAAFRERSQPSAVAQRLLLISLATLEQAWREFFFTPEPAVTVAAFRILFGVILVASLWYGPQGCVPNKQCVRIDGRSRFTVVQFLPNSDLTPKLVLAVFIAAAAALSLGILTTVSATRAFLVLVSVHDRNPAVLYGEDDVLRAMACLLIFSSAGAELSVDLRARLAKLGGTLWLEGSAAYDPTQVQEYHRYPLPRTAI